MTAALLVINWLLLATQFGGDGETLLAGLFYLAVALMAVLMTAVTGIVAGVWAFIYRHVWWGVGALALTLGACLAVFLLANGSSEAARTASVILPVGFLVYTRAWLTSYAARTPARPHGAGLKAERAS